MSPQHTIVIDASMLADVAPPDRDWLQAWLHNSKLRRRKELYTIGCASVAEVGRVTAMLTGRGLPSDAIITRGAA